MIDLANMIHAVDQLFGGPTHGSYRHCLRTYIDFVESVERGPVTSRRGPEFWGIGVDPVELYEVEERVDILVPSTTRFEADSNRLFSKFSDCAGKPHNLDT